MNWESWLPPVVVLSSFFPGIFIFLLQDKSFLTRTWLNLVGAVAKLMLVGVMLWGVAQERVYQMRLPMGPGLDLYLHSDPLSLLFVTLSAGLWLLTTIYAIGYLRGTAYQSRFFGFFSTCVSATTGIALSGNLITFLIFYELLTLATYPLVVHRGTAASVAAGRVYLIYTLAGGALLFLTIVWMQSLTGPVDFTERGVMAKWALENPGYEPMLTVLFFFFIASVGVKAALVPLHGWLPSAMVAPAPVTALLHAVAVVKAGQFGIVRVVYDVYGVAFAREVLQVTLPLAILASVTILYGSLRALVQDNLKRRLAFSTVSQLSYIALGVAIAGPIASIGGIVHIVHQGVMKITLFFCAGILHETLGIDKVSQMSGVARRLPWTMAAFTIGAFGMIGLPPTAGFISKWYLGVGAMEAGQPWVIGVLLASTLLNAAYFLPIVYIAWFGTQQGPWPEEHAGVTRPTESSFASWFRPQQGPWPEEHAGGRLETDWMLLFPVLLTALATLGLGLVAGTFFTPLEWAKLIMRREYGLME